jgi:nitroimidazol reductase NimA-like FMN-containing flavoprotein (pyridoxamine 5'-phosphate oxidase superfamily)
MIKNLEPSECIKILKQNYIGHLAYIFQNRPFVIPITYYYEQQTNSIIGYSSEGHKTKALRILSDVSVGVSEIESINNWQSVLAHGTYEELNGSQAKLYLHTFSDGIKNIIRQKEEKNPQGISDFSSKIYDEEVPVVFRISLDEITGKQRNHFNNNL